MMEKEYENAKKAYEEYNLNTEYRITEKILKNIRERIEANKEEIVELLKVYKREEKYEDIKRVIEEEVKGIIEYKRQVNIKRREDGFVSGIYKVSIGIVAVECYDILESIRYMIRGIKTRNAIIISDIEYDEKDVKNLVAYIINGVIKKENIEGELIQIVPYEECDYEKCDKVICTYDSKNEKEKEESEKMYVYIEDEKLREEGEREYREEREAGKEVEIVEGEMEEVIDRINDKENYGVVIYTTDSKKGYRFINLVRSKNVFVNATLENAEKVRKTGNKLLMNKKIMYEMKNILA